MVDSLENLQCACGHHRRYAHQEGKFRRRRPAHAQNQGEHDRRAGTRGTGKDRCHELAHPYSHHHRPRNVIRGFAPPYQPFHSQKDKAANQQCPSHRSQFFRQFDAFFINDEPANASDDEGRSDFHQVILRVLLAQLKNELVHPFRKQRDNGNNGTALDNHVKKVALMRLHQLLRNEQMSRGGNREKLRDSLNDAQD